MTPTLAYSDYVERLQSHVRLAFYRPRRFRSGQDWDQWSGLDWRGRALSDSEPSIQQVLNQRRVVIVGEPGSGKSTVARAAIDEALVRGWVPVLANLRSYEGELAQTFVVAVPDRAPGVTRLYILDGLDEVPPDHFQRLLADAERLLVDDASARILLTSRQAFFAARRDLFRAPIPVFHILDLDDDDVEAFIEHHGVERQPFRAAAERAEFSLELGNPFALNTLLTLFKTSHQLPATRSEAMRHVIDAFLAEQHTSRPSQERRALRMLAVAMETYARNELTESEAISVLIAALHTSDNEAQQLLEELTHSVLIRTVKGYAFQMRSYGEYLAAEELSEIQDRKKFLGLMQLQGSTDLSDSWRNAVSYLAELHTGTRRHFSRRHPDWMLSSMVGPFTTYDRDMVVRGVVDQLKTRREYLVHHPVVRARRLAPFVTDSTRRELIQMADSSDTVEVANALLLLGACLERSVAEKALAIALDPARDVYLRHSALHALARIGTVEMIPDLLAIGDWDESTVSSRLDAAGALATLAYLPSLLSSLARTDTIITGAVLRLRELEGPEFVETVLQSLKSLAPALAGSRMVAYLDPAWKQMLRHWKSDWARPVATFALTWGHQSGADILGDDLIKALSRNPAIAEEVGRAVIAELEATPRSLGEMNIRAFVLVGVDEARRLAEVPGQGEILSSLRAFGQPAVQQLLWNRSARTEEVPAAVARWQREADERDQRQKRAVETALGSGSPSERLSALASLDRSKWPDIPPAERHTLASAVSEALQGLNLRTSIRWSGTSWTMPRALPFLLQVVDRYELVVADDTILVLALMASEYEVVSAYVKRCGISNAAESLLEMQMSDASTPDGALDSMIRFVGSMPNVSDARLGLLEAIAVENARSPMVRAAAVQGLVRMDATGKNLRKLTGRIPAELARDVDDALVARQDRPTIERRIGRLLARPEDLDAGEGDVPFDGAMGWLKQVRDPVHWNKLVRLRQLTLERRLSSVGGLITQCMEAIDGIRTADVVERQVKFAPEEWQAVQRMHARRIRYEATIRSAQTAPFDLVLKKLRRATTLRLFKIWAEGTQDIPAWEALVAKLPDNVADDIVVRSIGGWNEVLARNFDPVGLTDGSDDQIVVLDGDTGRDFSTPAKHLRPEAREAINKIKNAGVEVEVLERYAFENYFPQSAFEAVMGQGIATHFPLNPDRPVMGQLPGYSKDMNAALAMSTTLTDLAGTDLGKILQDIAERAGD